MSFCSNQVNSSFFFPWNKSTELKPIFWKQICPRVFLTQTQQILGVVVELLPEIWGELQNSLVILLGSMYGFHSLPVWLLLSHTLLYLSTSPLTALVIFQNPLHCQSTYFETASKYLPICFSCLDYFLWTWVYHSTPYRQQLSISPL